MSKVLKRLVAAAAGLLALALATPAAAEWQAPSPIPEANDAHRAGDHAEALKLWQAACDAENPQGCYHAAIVHRDGEGVPVDKARSDRLLEQACEGGVGNGCFNLGNNAQGAEQIAWFERGCAIEHIGSCARLGMAYRDGEGVHPNAEAAVRYLTIACLVPDMTAGPACFELAAIYDAHLSALNDEPETANRWLEQGCARGDLDSCQNLAWHYAHGFGLRTDLVRSAALYQFACGDNAGLECKFVPAAHRGSGGFAGREIDQRWREAGGAYDRACKVDFAHGCFALARLIARNGKGADHKPKMRELLGKALALDPDHVAARELLRRVDVGELPERPLY